MMSKAPSAVFTFHTTADAMAAERLCRENGIPGRLIPAPRALTADCGIAWSSPPEQRERVATLFAGAGIEYADMRVL